MEQIKDGTVLKATQTFTYFDERTIITKDKNYKIEIMGNQVVFLGDDFKYHYYFSFKEKFSNFSKFPHFDY